MAQIPGDDPFGSPTWVSGHFLRLYGVDPRESTTPFPEWASFIHPEDRAAVLSHPPTPGHPEWRSDYRLVRNDGEIVPVHDVRIAVTEPHTGVVHWQVVIVEQPSRSPAAIAMERAARRDQALQMRQPLAMYVLETTLDVTKERYRVNQAMVDLLGYSMEEWVDGRGTWYRMIHPNDLERVLEQERLTDHTRLPFACEYRVTTKDGRLLWIRDQSMLMDLLPGGVEVWHGVIVDISEQRAQLEQLHEADVLLRSIIANSRDVIIVARRDGGRSFVSPSITTLLGIPMEDFPDIDPLQFVASDDAATLISAIRACWESGASLGPLNVRARHVDGTWRTLELVGSPHFDDPVINGVVITVRDISDRAAAIDALRESERRTRAFADATLDGVLGIDEHGRITDFNPAAERIWHLSRDEAIGHPATDFLTLPGWGSGDDMAFGVAPNTTMLNRRIASQGLRANGEAFPAEVSLVPMPVAGRPWFAGFVRDLTEQVGMEAALQASEERFRGAFEHAPIGMVVLDPSGHIMEANRAFQHLRASDAGIVGVALQSLLIAADQAWFAEELERLHATTSEATAGICRLQRQGAPDMWVTLAIAPIRDRESRIARFVCQIVDLTERMESDRIKNDFVATVSHELRTPLTAIAGFVDLLSSGVAGPMNDTAVRYLDVTNKNVRRLSALIEDLLDVSRMDAGRMELRMATMPLETSITAALEVVSPMITDKAQHLTVEIADDLPAVRGDSERLTQVITNLLSNANRYTQEGGQILLRASAPDGVVRVEVTDSGIGIAADEQGRIFDRFYRSAEARKRVVGGTGLGLAIAKSLVDLHGGTMGFTSEHGRGSTFWFTIPMADPNP